MPDRADTPGRLLAFPLALCLLANPIIGEFIRLSLRKAAVRAVRREVEKHIVAGIDENNLILFKFSVEESQTRLRWEHPREFEYNREMYDIVETWTDISSFDYGHLRQGAHGPDDYLKPFYVQRQDGVDRVITQDDLLLQIPSGYSQNNMMQKVRFKPDEKWDLQYAFHYSETSSCGRYDRHNRFRSGRPRYAEWDYDPQKWMMNNLTVSTMVWNT